MDSVTKAMFTAHGGNAFFMNWMGTQGDEGFEYPLLTIGLSFVVRIQGVGKALVAAIIAGPARK
jgi:hypothetical protein